MTKRSSKETNPAKQVMSGTLANGGVGTKSLAKSADPAYTKFTIYIKKATHLAVKMRMVGAQRELSDLVEDLMSAWLKENNSNDD